ncbi:hypothetical protein D3C73_870570 [compost metagenome]
MLIRMKLALYNHLIMYSRHKLPDEACGFILGESADFGYQATYLVPIDNVSPCPQHQFLMEPSQMMKALFSPDKKIIGIFHSHPLSEGIPSDEDLQSHWHTLPTHWIMSFQTQQPSLSIFHIKRAPLTSPRKLSFEIDQ